MKNYMNPPIPKGFIHISGTWDRAFIIEDVKSQNRFTWVPLGIHNEISYYLEKSKNTIGMEYDFTKEMIEKYGGIYVSTYLISKSVVGKAKSNGLVPWTDVTFVRARNEAAKMCIDFKGVLIHTRLIYDMEYDIVAETISTLLNLKGELLTNKQFEEYGLYQMEDLWIWTLTNYREFSMILKKGDPKEQKHKVYANNEWFESEKVGFRAVLILF